MLEPDLIPADHANLWRAARAWFDMVSRTVFTAGFTVFDPGRRPDVIGWLDDIERLIRTLIIAAALALKPGAVQRETRIATGESWGRNPTFAPTTPLPAFIDLPAQPRAANGRTAEPAAQPAATSTPTAALDLIAQPARKLAATDASGEAITRFLVLQRLLANPERLIRRLALRVAARAARSKQAVIGWAATHLIEKPAAAIHALIATARDAALDAAATFMLQHPEPG